MLGWDETEENWIAGRKSAGTKGFLPVWEQGFPPILLMREKIRGLSLDELAELMVVFTQEQGAANEEEKPASALLAADVARLRRLGCISQTFREARRGRSRSGSIYEP